MAVVGQGLNHSLNNTMCAQSMDIFICLGAGFNAGGKDIVHSICRPKLVLAVALSLRLDSVIGYQKRTFTYYPRSSESMQQGV